ncbi:protein jag [Knoellia sp. CPCC 206453]|uniref:Jag family protein n=1 Tax=Knoellia pratensis TaxID=3404796 RepID=UPI00361CEFB7
MSELTDQETAETAAVDKDPTATVESTESTESTDVEESQDDSEVEESGTETTSENTDKPAAKEAPADLEKEGEVAADFLENLLDICDLDGDIDVDIDGDRAAVAIVDSEEGRVPRRLVGDNAKVLDALQELTRLAVQAATGHRSRLMLDVAGHRAGRRAELVEVAKVAIDSVKESGERAALDPMTAFERKVVHDEVLAAGLSSESEGVEPRRHVVVLPA